MATTGQQRSTTIPPTPGADAPMTILSGEDICQLLVEGMSTEVINHLLIPQEVADLATISTPMAL